MAEKTAGPKIVMTCQVADGVSRSHDKATQTKIAEQLAVLMGWQFAEERRGHDRRQIYWVPDDTIAGLAAARELGITTEQDLFGGVVPHSFAATKAITHQLPSRAAAAPFGWSYEFGECVDGAVLPGYTAFSREDAHAAGLSLLKRGPVRVKPVRAKAGRGQTLVSNVDELEAALESVQLADLQNIGVVLEENLTEVTTYSVGQIRVGDLRASYCGRQRLTNNARGEEVYGGSDLLIARGEFQALMKLGVPENVRLAVRQAQLYDAAAMECFKGMFASRRNYDVAQGRDAAGSWCSGVLEQSWRIGGASSAEILALQAFRRDPKVAAVHAASMEVYGASDNPPPHAVVYFRGTDERTGLLTKYATIDQYEHA